MDWASTLQRARSRLPRFRRRQAHFWPFDGWAPPRGRSVIAEVYPSLCSRAFPSEDSNPRQHDAYSVARWMQQSDAADTLPTYFNPQLSPPDRKLAQLEGWILGLA